MTSLHVSGPDKVEMNVFRVMSQRLGVDEESERKGSSEEGIFLLKILVIEKSDVQ
jgi:hypothetical protein